MEGRGREKWGTLPALPTWVLQRNGVKSDTEVDRVGTGRLGADREADSSGSRGSFLRDTEVRNCFELKSGLDRSTKISDELEVDTTITSDECRLLPLHCLFF